LEGSAHRSRRRSTSRCGRRSGWPNSPRKNAAFCRRCATRARRRATRGARLRPVSHPNRRRCRGKPKTPCPSQDAQLHPQKRRVFAKVRNSRPKTRDSAARPWPVSRPSHRRCRGTQKRPAQAKTRNCYPPKSAAFFAKVRNSRAKARNSAAGPGRSPDRTSAAAGGKAKTARASEGVQLPPLKKRRVFAKMRNSPRATDNRPNFQRSLRQASESRHLPALRRSTARLARGVRVQNHPSGLPACQTVPAAARPRRRLRQPAIMPSCLPLLFRRSSAPKSSHSQVHNRVAATG